MIEVLFYTAIGATLLFAFINGFHDGCNVIATIIGSRSMRPRKALLLASLAEFVGPLVLGTAVAGTIAGSILDVELLQQLPTDRLYVLVIAAVTGAIFWNIFTWIVGLPSSSSHALIGGLIGAGVLALGPHAIAQKRVLMYVVAPLFISPILGFVAGYMLFALLRGVFARSHSAITHFFKSAQVPGMLFLGAGHGSNDAQKSMGLIAMVLAAGSADLAEIHIPLWVMLSCAAAISIGLSTGGWTIIKTVGYGIFRMKPIHSFASQASSTTVIAIASVLGGPVSTTQVVASSVLGVGTSKRLSGVRWGLAKNILYAWILTIPISAAIGAGFCWCLVWLVQFF